MKSKHIMTLINENTALTQENTELQCFVDRARDLCWDAQKSELEQNMMLKNSIEYQDATVKASDVLKALGLYNSPYLYKIISKYENAEKDGDDE